jgi:hypothetical protein
MLSLVLSSLIFVAFFVALGVRLVRVFRREGRAPELFIALSFLATSVGITGQLVAMAPDSPDTTVRIGASLASVAFFVAGVAVLRFLALAFRAGDRTAEFVTHVGIFFAVVLGGFALGRVVETPLASLRRFDGAGLGGNAFLCATLAWLTVEAFLHFGRLRRRSALGLADPVLMNRMLLYGVGSLLSVLTMLSTLVPALAWGIDPMENPVLRGIGATLGMPIGVIYYLALLPPARYCRWLQGTAHP